jgi:mono/diheme cytochrome c family protein
VVESKVSSAGTDTAPISKPTTAQPVNSGAYSRIEGEQRYRANCGRCHMAPHKFPPRMMATIVRHMRVRATITDEDMKFILRYMTE